MKCFVSFACVMSVLFAVSLAAPYFPQSGFSASTGLQVGGSTGVAATGSAQANFTNPLTTILSSIDLPSLLRGVNGIVSVLRQYCPPLGQLVDNVIQNVTSTAFRVFGRILLRQGGLGGGGGASGGSGGARVNVVLPTFPPDEDDYTDEDSDSDSDSDSSANSNGDLRIADSASTSAASTSSGGPTTDPNSELVSATNDDNTIQKRHVRVVREANQEVEEEEEEEDDQDGAESAPQPAEDSSVDDQDRNKRFLPFGATVSGGHGGAAGGSGNFLFDIIRLVAGSGATEEGDDKLAAGSGGVAEVDISKAGGHGYTEGIPGPITRLFVIANRGLANLVQDLILRLAQTSEKFVNFKARLVTSLI